MLTTEKKKVNSKTRNASYSGKIMLATNFSDASKNALNYTTALATKLNAKIILLHIFQSIDQNTQNRKEKAKEIKSIKENAEKNLTKLCKEIHRENIQCDYLNLEGWAEDVIEEQVKKINPDFLVMGVESVTKLEMMIFMTIREKILESTNCNVLLVPKNSIYKAPKKMAFAVDFHYSDLNDVKFLSLIAEILSMDLHVIHVVTEDENLDLEENSFNNFKKDIQKLNLGAKMVFNILVGRNVTTEIKKYVNEKLIDFLTVAKTEKGTLERLFFGSISHKLSMDINVPLFIFHAKDDVFELF